MICSIYQTGDGQLKTQLCLSLFMTVEQTVIVSALSLALVGMIIFTQTPSLHSFSVYVRMLMLSFSLPSAIKAQRTHTVSC